ncbi:hypothetical protein HL667_29255 [Bradyrhizobium sp. 83012]|uniref:Uncharacterized protein n=1 Tax=Bradyrhizobium aeschynomenes TaxID=2734909 RepID=A0ABX2CLP9_9BRAD|nr:hypothetical protein [Bradyrhizobium aeschynomenes]NPU11659.1 hypothetical protein [Bradyrhizobium aeschynomenes]NPU69124.1 hypothetical protein [Bradyrhizobium aeschynomenes]NPV23878.1 hypothetical protein [Bradyrhizobium aeschynomenes]
MRVRSILLAIGLIASAGTAHAADPRYPDWPCPQAKVPEISIAAVWAGPPIDDVGTSWKDDAKIAELVAKLAARRIPLEQAQKDVADFLTGTAEEKTRKGKLLFAGLFDTLNAQRTSVMNGLERVMRKQREAVDKVRGDTIALQEMHSSASQDQAKIEEMTNQLNWETRIFEDRRRVMKFVCEVPTAIDQRLFALAREIQQDME